MDVDFAIAVRDWDQFAAVHARLLARGSFTADRVQQPLYYKGEDGNLVAQLDLVPFGAIADRGKEIAGGLFLAWRS